MKKFSKKYLNFPLCCLTYPGKNYLDLVIAYSVVKYSQKIEESLDPRLCRYDKDYPHGFDDSNEEHIKILLGAAELNEKIQSIPYLLDRFELMDKHVTEFEDKYGNDAYCSIGKELIYETKNKIFSEELFRILCAIQSVLGKKTQFSRITKETIRFRMWGYKSKKIFEAKNPSDIKLFTDRVIGKRIELLVAKGFVTKFTYAKRETYFSTRLSEDELIEKVRDKKIYWAKRNLNTKEQIESEKIRSQINAMKEFKSNLRLVKKEKIVI